MVTIVTVLKSGKEYRAAHVQWLHAQLPENIPAICLSDVEIPGITTLPLMGNWPGWWSKLEIFNPDLPGIGDQDLLYLDLDTVITGDITPLLEVKTFIAATDFYREKYPVPPMNSTVMYIPTEIKNIVWTAWLNDPEKHMRECTLPHKHGDQGFIGSIVDPLRWQDVMPGAIVSYKKDIAAVGRWSHSVGNGTVPKGTRLVCFHGQPRPWQSGESWVPPLTD